MSSIYQNAKSAIKKLLLRVLKPYFESEYYLRNTPPSTFSIETSLACNLKCPECALGGDMINRKHAFMSLEHFKKIADKIRPFAPKIDMVYLHIWGEPMLNKDIIQMIRYVSGFAKVNISTNGLMLTPKTAEQLVNSGVYSIIFSIDGMTQEVYEKYRVGGDVEKALASLKMLRDFNAMCGGKVMIMPQFIVFRHNQHEIERFKEHCSSLGLEYILKAPYIRSGSRFSNSDFPEYVREKYKNDGLRREAMRGCPDPRKCLTILIDGSVVACCYDFDGKTCFGNIFDQDVMEIWRSPAFMKFRYGLIHGNTPGYCIKECLVYGLEDREN